MVELIGEADGITTDLITESPLAIEVTIKEMNGCTRATATIGNGKVTIPGRGFQWQFEDTDLNSLCARTCRLGIKVTIRRFHHGFD